MAHHNTVFSQFLQLVPRHEFERLANRQHTGRKLRRMNRWTQFVSMALGQLTDRVSLRDIVNNLDAQYRHHYHLGCHRASRSSLARANENLDSDFYRDIFMRLYQRCTPSAPGHRFRFKHKLFSLDGSLIDLSLKIFPWADFNGRKAALKLHIGLDHDGYIPAFATITPGKQSDMSVARTLNYPKGSIVVFDKGYNDLSWHNALSEQGIFYVSRIRNNALYRVTERRDVNEHQGVICDQTIEYSSTYNRQRGLQPVRRIRYKDAETGKSYVFITNNFSLSAKTIADIYKERWQVELFFKWLKQNLKIKAFLGTSLNAIKTQIWTALCTYLLVAFMKFSSRTCRSMQQIIRLLQLNLFVKRSLGSLLMAKPPDKNPVSPQLTMRFT